MILRLWSIAQHDLRLSTGDFLRLTPKQFDALLKRHERAAADREFLFAQVIEYIVNCSLARPKEGAKARDFMPSEWAKQRVPTKRIRATPRRREEMADWWRSLAAASKASPSSAP